MDNLISCFILLCHSLRKCISWNQHSFEALLEIAHIAHFRRHRASCPECCFQYLLYRSTSLLPQSLVYFLFQTRRFHSVPCNQPRFLYKRHCGITWICCLSGLYCLNFSPLIQLCHRASSRFAHRSVRQVTPLAPSRTGLGLPSSSRSIWPAAT